jgi:hypothetical protein
MTDIGARNIDRPLMKVNNEDADDIISQGTVIQPAVSLWQDPHF